MAELGRKSLKHLGKHILHPECAEHVTGGAGRGGDAEDGDAGMEIESRMSP